MELTEERYTDMLEELAEGGFHFSPINASEDSSKIVYPDGQIPTIDRM